MEGETTTLLCYRTAQSLLLNNQHERQKLFKLSQKILAVYLPHYENLETVNCETLENILLAATSKKEPYLTETDFRLIAESVGFNESVIHLDEKLSLFVQKHWEMGQQWEELLSDIGQEMSLEAADDWKKLLQCVIMSLPYTYRDGVMLLKEAAAGGNVIENFFLGWTAIISSHLKHGQQILHGLLLGCRVCKREDLLLTVTDCCKRKLKNHGCVPNEWLLQVHQVMTYETKNITQYQYLNEQLDS